MGSFITDLKNSFNKGNIYIQFIYINVGVFIVTSLLGILWMLFNRNGAFVLQYLELPAWTLQFVKQPWSLLTYMFMHDTHSFAHVFFNMFGVYMFGRVLENVWGPKRFLIFYMVTGIGAGITQELVWLYSVHSFASANGVTLVQLVAGDPSLNYLITIGASGSVFGILLAFAMLFPNVPLYLMFIPIPIKAKYFVIFYGLAELFMGVANNGGDSVAHFAHLGGMLFGYFLVRYWKKKDIDNGRYFY